MVLIEEEVLKDANISEAELRIEIALMLFQQHRLTAGKAARFAGMPEFEFERLLAKKNIPKYYYEDDDLELDLKALEKMRQA